MEMVKAFVLKLLSNETAMWWVMSFLIFILSQILKLPIKLLTKHLPEKTRKRINSIILLIPFGLGVLAIYAYYVLFLKAAFVPANGFILGGQSIAMYGVFERFLGKKIDNPYDTAEGKEVLAKVDGIVKDRKVTKKEVKSLILTDEEQDKIDKLLYKDNK